MDQGRLHQVRKLLQDHDAYLEEIGGEEISSSLGDDLPRVF